MSRYILTVLVTFVKGLSCFFRETSPIPLYLEVNFMAYMEEPTMVSIESSSLSSSGRQAERPNIVARNIISISRAITFLTLTYMKL